MKLQRRIRGVNVVISCLDSFGAQAEGLLDKLEELDRRGPQLRDGTTIQFGWARLTLRLEGDELVVCEPSFGTAEVDSQLSRSVDDTLIVLLEQTELMQKIGVEQSQDVDYHQKVVVAEGALDCAHVYMVRQNPSGPDDSGWFIGDAENPDRSKDPENLRSMQVHELVRQTHLMSALILPTGFMVTFLGGMLETVADASGRELFTLH